MSGKRFGKVVEFGEVCANFARLRIYQLVTVPLPPPDNNGDEYVEDCYAYLDRHVQSSRKIVVEVHGKNEDVLPVLYVDDAKSLENFSWVSKEYFSYDQHRPTVMGLYCDELRTEAITSAEVQELQKFVPLWLPRIEQRKE